MSDVFISYARSTEAQADRITDALRSLGYDVWRDDQLPAHRAYGEVIEERLHLAKAVVVIWSADALQSVWVRSEADRARLLRKLVQVSVDGSRLPMPFDQIQCADLAGWTGDPDNRGFRKVIDSVAELLSGHAARTGTGETDAPAAAPHAEPPPIRPAPAAAKAVVREDAPQPPVAAPPEAPTVVAPPSPAEPPPAAPPPPADVTPEVEPEPPVATPPEAAAVAPPPAAAPHRPRTPVPVAPADPPLAAPVSAADTEVIPEVAPEPPAAPQPEGSTALALSPLLGAEAPRRRGPPVALIAVTAVAAAAAIGGGVWLANQGPAPHQPSTAHAPNPAAPGAPAPLNPAYAQIAQAADALPADARSQGRPAGETADLTQLATQIDGLLAQLRSAPAGQIVPLTTQLNQAAAKGAQAEAATLSNAADGLAGEAESTLRGGGAPASAAQALAALRGSTQKLDAATAAVSSAADAASSLAALHAALADWSQVRTDYTSAAALYAPALRARFEAAADAARAEAQRVIAGAASASRPWLFASRAQKDAYKALQDHAAEAKTDLGELDGLAHTVADSSDQRQLRSAIARAGEIRGSLAALASAASAAAPGH